MKTFWTGKRIAVTGAGGFIGGHMVHKLMTEGADVTAIVMKHPVEAAHGSMPGPRVIRADLTDPAQTQQALKNQYGVFHFAGLDGGAAFKRDHELEILQTNTRISLNILEAARQNAVSRLLLMSSVEVYPRTSGTYVSETTGKERWFSSPVSGYAWTKRVMETYSKFYQGDTLKIAIARSGNIYGPGDEAESGRVVPTFIRRALRNEQIRITAHKDTRIAFMYVEDLVRALGVLLESYAECDPVNVTGSRRISLYALAKRIVKLTGSHSEIVYDPQPPNRPGSTYYSRAKLRRLAFAERFSLDDGIKLLLK